MVEAIAGSLVVTAPPSPQAPRFLVGKKLKQPILPILPTLAVSQAAPVDWAQSSITVI